MSWRGLCLCVLCSLVFVACGQVIGNSYKVVTLGRSVEGRAIVVHVIGDPGAAHRVLVVGCIHGNECAGTAITSLLLQLDPPPNTQLWVVPELNPDGAAADTRQNAHGVDLNRNFPWRWRPLEGVFDSGPRPLSEPESWVAYHLVLSVRPEISIWFHQHLDVVDESGGDTTIEGRFAALTGLLLVRLAREPGSVVGWENHVLPGHTAFVVELPAGELGSSAASRFAAAVETIATP